MVKGQRGATTQEVEGWMQGKCRRRKTDAMDGWPACRVGPGELFSVSIFPDKWTVTEKPANASLEKASAPFPRPVTSAARWAAPAAAGSAAHTRQFILGSSMRRTLISFNVAADLVRTVYMSTDLVYLATSYKKRQRIRIFGHYNRFPLRLAASPRIQRWRHRVDTGHHPSAGLANAMRADAAAGRWLR